MARAGFVYVGPGAKGVEMYIRPCGCRIFQWKIRLDDMTVEFLEARSCEGRILRPRIPDPRWPHEPGRWARDWMVVR